MVVEDTEVQCDMMISAHAEIEREVLTLDVRGKLNELVDPTEAVADYLLDSGVTVQEWIPVTERMPEENEYVMIWCGECQIERTGGDGKYSYTPVRGVAGRRKKEPDIRCAADALRQQLSISEEALSQLRFIAERLGV